MKKSFRMSELPITHPTRIACAITRKPRKFAVTTMDRLGAVHKYTIADPSIRDLHSLVLAAAYNADRMEDTVLEVKELEQ